MTLETHNSELKVLESILGQGRVKENFELAPYTTFKIGGIAEFYFQTHSQDDLINAVKAAFEAKIRLTIFGGISNVIIGDQGIKGLVVINRTSDFEIVEDSPEYARVKISSGYSMTRLAQETAEKGLSGFEYHFGLPGTLGGAIYMNSKWAALTPIVYVGNNLENAQLITREGEIKEVDHDYFHFAYDYSILQKTKEIVIKATYKMKKENPKILLKRNQEALDYRKKTQPYGVPSSGCYFQNVNGHSAGKMIDDAGLKGYTVGGATISNKHANFIVNNGNATGEDVRMLVKQVKEVIKQKHKIELKEEVILI